MLRVFVRRFLKYIEDIRQDDQARIRAFMLGLGGAHRFNSYAFQQNGRISKLYTPIRALIRPFFT